MFMGLFPESSILVMINPLMNSKIEHNIKRQENRGKWGCLVEINN